MTKEHRIKNLLKPMIGSMSAEEFLYNMAESMDVQMLRTIKNDVCERRTGRTTRIVDHAIQEFFNLKKNESVMFEDHHPYYPGNENLARRIARRLFTEFELNDKEHFEIYHIGQEIRLTKKF